MLVTNNNYKKISEYLDSYTPLNGDAITLDFRQINHASIGFVNLVPQLYAIRNCDAEKWKKIQLLNFDFKYFKFDGLQLPDKLEIEPTMRCNLKCPYCPTTFDEIPGRAEMSLSDFKNIIDYYVIAPDIDLWGLGEPLLHKDIFKMIRYAKQRGSRQCAISTNGCFISPENMFQFFTSRLDEVILSIDGASKETYSSHRKGSDFKKVLKNVYELCKFKREKGFRNPRITVQFIITSYNEHEVPVMCKLAKKLGVNRLVLKTVSTGRGTEHFLPKNIKYHRYGEELTRSDWCYILWDRASISSEGDVVFCCRRFQAVDQIKIGNVFQTDLNSIWNGEKYKYYRRLMLEGKKDSLGCNVTCPVGQKFVFQEYEFS